MRGGRLRVGGRRFGAVEGRRAMRRLVKAGGGAV